MSSLYGHDGTILDIAPSHEWSITVSSSADGSSIIWDTRNYSYIRTIRDDVSLCKEENKAHRLLRVSKSSGDIIIGMKLTSLKLSQTVSH